MGCLPLVSHMRVAGLLGESLYREISSERTSNRNKADKASKARKESKVRKIEQRKTKEKGQ